MNSKAKIEPVEELVEELVVETVVADPAEVLAAESDVEPMTVVNIVEPLTAEQELAVAQSNPELQDMFEAIRVLVEFAFPAHAVFHVVTGLKRSGLAVGPRALDLISVVADDVASARVANGI